MCVLFQLSCLVGRWRWTRLIPNRSAALIQTVVSATSSEVRARTLNEQHAVKECSDMSSFKYSNLFLADAYENARNLCDRYYMNSPELVLEEFSGKKNTLVIYLLQAHTFIFVALRLSYALSHQIFWSLFVPAGNPTTVVYVPSHLYHMVFELFKVGFAFLTYISMLHFLSC